MRRYSCNRLFGFSGMVYSISLSAIKEWIAFLSPPETDRCPKAFASANLDMVAERRSARTRPSTLSDSGPDPHPGIDSGPDSGPDSGLDPGLDPGLDWGIGSALDTRLDSVLTSGVSRTASAAPSRTTFPFLITLDSKLYLV